MEEMPFKNLFFQFIFYPAGCKSAYSVLQGKQGQAFFTPGSSLCPTMRALGYSARRSFSSDQREAFCISVRVSAGRPFSLFTPHLPHDTSGNLDLWAFEHGSDVFISPISLPSSPPYDTFITLTI